MPRTQARAATRRHKGTEAEFHPVLNLTYTVEARDVSRQVSNALREWCSAPLCGMHRPVECTTVLDGKAGYNSARACIVNPVSSVKLTV